MIQVTPDKPIQILKFSQTVDYGTLYLWTKYPLPKDPYLELAAFNFDTPSAVLFFFYFAAIVALLKIFTHLGSILGLGTIS